MQRDFNREKQAMYTEGKRTSLARPAGLMDKMAGVIKERSWDDVVNERERLHKQGILNDESYQFLKNIHDKMASRANYNETPFLARVGRRFLRGGGD